MKLNQLLAIVCLFLSSALYAQPRCGFDEMHRKRLKDNSEYKENVSSNEKSISTYIEKNKRRLTSKVIASGTALYKIPVVVHVVHTGGAIGSIYNPTDAQIEGAINYLNQVYNGTYPGTTGAGDIQIQFVLPERDPNCNTTSGINRINGSAIPNYASGGVNAETSLGTDELNVKNLSRWDPSEYYNIWIVNKIDGNDGTFGSFIAGFAYFPGAEPYIDGTIMLATQMKAGQKTLPHEIGHSLALYHPFEDSGTDGSTCPANDSPTLDGDMVADTDPITLPVGFVCRNGTNSCTGTDYSQNTENNYMNYTNCYNLFTPGQRARMQAAAASIFRKSLTTSAALSSTNILSIYSSPKPATCTPITSSTGLSGPYTGILNINVNNTNRYSSTADGDGGYVDGTSSCIKLIPLIQGNTYTFSGTVYGYLDEQIRAWIDYNNDGTFNDAEEIFRNTNIPSHPTDFVTASNLFTIPATAALNTVLRMRVINEVSAVTYGYTINNACYNPEYGQAEDYAVYISPAPLPVVLGEFSGLIKDNQAILKWNTKLETNAKHFEIEKSTDGTNFQKIGIVSALGNSTNQQNYTFLDQKVQSHNYYRIKMVDQDLKSSYSKVIVLKNETTSQNIWLNTSFLNETIELTLNKSAKEIKLQLISTNGVIVDQMNFQNVFSIIKWNLTDKKLSSGVYILHVLVDGNTFIYKLLKR